MTTPKISPILRTMEIPDRDEYMGAKAAQRDIWEIYVNTAVKGFIPIALKGKVPLLKNWQNTTRDNMLINFTEGIRMGADNVGIVTGPPSGIVVVDVDNKIIPTRPDLTGIDMWINDVRFANIDPTTYTVMTGSGGYHFYYKYDAVSAPFRSAPIPNHNIDIKTTGGQVVAPGSIHPETGKEYIIVTDVPIVSMPPRLASYLQALQNQ